MLKRLGGDMICGLHGDHIANAVDQSSLHDQMFEFCSATAQYVL